MGARTSEPTVAERDLITHQSDLCKIKHVVGVGFERGRSATGGDESSESKMLEGAATMLCSLTIVRGRPRKSEIERSSV